MCSWEVIIMIMKNFVWVKVSAEVSAEESKEQTSFIYNIYLAIVLTPP